MEIPAARGKIPCGEPSTQLRRQPHPTARRVLIQASPVCGERVVGKAAAELLEGDPTLQPSQRCADAVVNALSEAEMSFSPALEVEVVGAVEPALVAICRAVTEPHSRSWDGGIYINEETERPEKNPGLGAVIGVALLGVIFVAMFGTFQGIAPLGALNAHAANAAAFVGHRLGGGIGDRVISLAVVLSMLATTQVAIIGTARLIYSMSRDRVLPARLGVVSERYRTPAFTTALLGGVMMVFGVIDIFVTSVATAIGDLVTVSGVLYSLFYATTGLAAAWFYRRFIGRSLKDALILGLMPLAGAGLLIWVAYKGLKVLTETEALILGGVAVLGLVMLVVAVTVYKSPIFKIKAKAATTTEPTLHVGVG